MVKPSAGEHVAPPLRRRVRRRRVLRRGRGRRRVRGHARQERRRASPGQRLAPLRVPQGAEIRAGWWIIYFKY